MTAASVPAVPHLDHHAAVTVEPVDFGYRVAAVVPALGHRLGLCRLDRLHPAVPGNRLLGEVLHRVRDGRPVRVVRLGRDPDRLGVVVLAAAARHAPVGHLAAAAAAPYGRRRRVTAARVRSPGRRVPSRATAAAAAAAILVLVVQRLVQLGRVVHQSLHEHLFLGIVPAAVRRGTAAVAQQLAGAGPAAGQRPIPVVRRDRRQVFGAPAEHAHDVRALQRRRRFFQPVQRAHRPRLVARVRLHVETLAPEQRRFRKRPLRLDWPVGERHVDHAAGVRGGSVQTVIVFPGCVHLRKRKARCFSLVYTNNKKKRTLTRERCNRDDAVGHCGKSRVIKPINPSFSSIV